MKLYYQKALMLLAIIIAAFTSSANAQLKNLPFELGLNFSVLNPSTEFDESKNLKFSSYIRGFLRLELTGRLEGEIGGGFIRLAGLNHLHKYYRTNMYPIDFRLTYSPVEFNTWKPYISAGFGYAYWTFKYTARERSPLRTDYDGYTRLIPLTAGAEFKITQQLSFDLNFGYTHTSTSGLNAYKSETGFLHNDGAFNFGAGLVFAINPPAKQKDFDGISGCDLETPKINPEQPVKPVDGGEVTNSPSDTSKTVTDEAGKINVAEVKVITDTPVKDNVVEKAPACQSTGCQSKVCQSTVKPEEDEVFDMEVIQFATNSSAITTRSESILKKNLDYLLKHPEVKIQVNGHTDNTGQLAYNMTLSEKRAAAVKNWLVKKGIQAERISIKYFGPKEPLVPNNIAERRYKNRRAEVKRIDF